MSKNQSSVFWLIDQPGKSGDSYLLGTMHSSANDALYHFSTFATYLAQSSRFFAETNLDSNLLQSLPSNPTLKWAGYRSILSEHALAKAHHILKLHYKVDLYVIESLPPLIISAIVADSFIQTNQNGQVTLDQKLWNTAKSLNLEVEGIESPQTQYDIFRKIPISYQASQLKKMITHISRTSFEMNKISRAYKDQKLNKIYSLSKKSLGSIRKILLHDRNSRMAHQINEILKHNSGNFVSIGAAHLPGYKGVLRLLKQYGWQLRPIHLKY